MPHWLMRRRGLPLGGFSGVLQHNWTITLTPMADISMQRNGFPMLYKRAAFQLSTLDVCQVENVLFSVHLSSATSNGTSGFRVTTQFRTPFGGSLAPCSCWGSCWFQARHRVRKPDCRVNIWMCRKNLVKTARDIRMQIVQVQDSRHMGAEILNPFQHQRDSKLNKTKGGHSTRCRD